MLMGKKKKNLEISRRDYWPLFLCSSELNFLLVGLLDSSKGPKLACRFLQTDNANNFQPVKHKTLMVFLIALRDFDYNLSFLTYNYPFLTYNYPIV